MNSTKEIIKSLKDKLIRYSDKRSNLSILVETNEITRKQYKQYYPIWTGRIEELETQIALWQSKFKEEEELLSMIFPYIKVQDNGLKSSKPIHRVGRDYHDSLYINENGLINYYNLQNGEGTMGDYEFVGYTDEYSPFKQIEMKPLREILSDLKGDK